jgi:hypothetical protein
VANNILPMAQFPFWATAFYAEGLYWVFYENGSYEFYSTSPDGINWQQPVLADSASGIVNCDYYDVYYNGAGTVYNVISPNQSPYILYKIGTLNANGIITWGTETQMTTSIAGGGAAVSVDSNGYPWIIDADGIIKDAYNNGSWAIANGFPYPISNGASTWGTFSTRMCPLTNGKMAVYCDVNSPTTYGWMTVWTGTTWTTDANTTAFIGGESSGLWSSDAISENNTDAVLLVYHQSSTNAFACEVYNYTTNTFGAELVFGPVTIAFTIPLLAIDPVTGNIFCVYTNYAPQPPVVAYYQIYANNAWSSPEIFVDDTNDYSISYAVGLSCTAYQGELCLLYINCTNPPTTSVDKLMFAHTFTALSDSSLTAGSISASTTIAGSSCQFSASATGNYGISDYMWGSNCSGTVVNGAWQVFTNNPVTYTTTLSANAGDTDTVTLYVSDTAGNQASATYSITLTTNMPTPTPTPSPSPSPTASPTPTPTSTPTATPTPTPAPSSSPTPSATTVPATTASGATVDLAISGNIISSQMSNVTITTNQSATTTTLSFTVTGESGTTGFGNITIPKNAVPYGTTPTIYIDGQQAQNQGYTQDSNNYYVWYTTQFSTHEISIVFTAGSSIPEFPTWIILPLLAIVILLSIVFIRKRIPKNSSLFRIFYMNLHFSEALKRYCKGSLLS